MADVAYPDLPSESSPALTDEFPYVEDPSGTPVTKRTTLTGMLAAANLSSLGTTTSAELATVINNETGTGVLVFATSPTLVTPALGTPASGVLSGCSAYPVTNLAGAGTNVVAWLANPTSVNLKAAVTAETGSGALCFATSPTLTTPSIGSPVITGFLNIPLGAELTIATGAVTATGSWHTIDTEADAPSDPLITINGGTEGDILIIQAVHDDRSVVVTDNTGNLRLQGDFTMDHTTDSITLQKVGSNWEERMRTSGA